MRTCNINKFRLRNFGVIPWIIYKCNTDAKLQTDSQKKDHFYCQNFGFIYINLCFSHKISYFFEISTVNVHISIKVFVSDKINLVKITTVTESSTFRTSYFSHQVVFQVMLCPCIFLTGNIIVCVAATQHSFQIRTAVSLGA